MPKYEYRHTLLPDDANLQSRTSEHARVIRASFALAELAHRGESRGKRDANTDYISHPIIVYDILSKFGETDTALLSAAFLHDVLELSHYRDDPERLQRELEVEFEREGIPHARAKELADDIYQLVYEVTNPEVLPKIKELYQIDRVEGMSFRAKKLKIADQCASLMCNRMEPNDPAAMSYDQERVFAEKADALCYAIVASVQDDPKEREALEPYAAFAWRAQQEVNRLFLAPDATTSEIVKKRAYVRREEFDIDSLFTGEFKAFPVWDENDVVMKLSFYTPQELPEELESGKALGLLRADLDKMGRVSRFYMHVSPRPGKEIEANQLQQTFTAEIRERLRWSSAYTETGKETVELAALHPGERAANDNVRMYHLHPPMLAEAFAAAALTAKVCTKANAAAIGSTGAKLKTEHLKKPEPKPNADGPDKEQTRMERLLGRGRGDTPGR